MLIFLNINGTARVVNVGGALRRWIFTSVDPPRDVFILDGLSSNSTGLIKVKLLGVSMGPKVKKSTHFCNYFCLGKLTIFCTERCMEAKFGADDKPRAFTRHGWVRRAKVNVLFL